MARKKESEVILKELDASDQGLFHFLMAATQSVAESDGSAYIPVKPHPKQQLFLDLDDTKEALFGGATGGGKLLRLDEPVPTPDGWTTMGEITAGDAVLDESGNPCLVTVAHPIQTPDEAFRITFDDGTTIDAGGEHLWHTFTAAERNALTRRSETFRARRRATRPSHSKGTRSAHFVRVLTERNQTVLRRPLPPPAGGVRTTKEIYETLRIGNRVNHSVPIALPLNLPDADDLPIDPYCLGAWLGDGTAKAGSFTGIDPEIWERFKDAGYEFREGGDGKSHYIRQWTVLLRKAGVFGNKHIPARYLRAGYNQRLDLLKGLMDTDGYAGIDGSVEFCNTNRRIIDGIYELIVGLGWKCTVRTKEPKCNGKVCATAYVIKWRPTVSVFHLPRKVRRQKMGTRLTTRMRYIVDCQPIEPVPMRCITVDSPQHLYLAGRSMVPTHNSISLLADALKYVHIPNYSALLLRRTFPELRQEGGLISVAHSWLSKTDAKWNEQDKTWTFPSGATLKFGYMDNENDKYRYQGGEYQYIGFDELTQFTQSQYLYLFSRLRKRGDIDAPLRIRGATNPGGIGGRWVFERFIPEDFTPADARQMKVWKKPQSDGHEIAFVPSLLDDNPSLDREDYLQSLSQLDEITRQQYISGDWMIQIRGDILYTYSEPHSVISWSQFSKATGYRQIPSHWKIGVYLDWGTTPEHPCAVTWFATAGMNSELAGKVFIYRGILLDRCTAVDVAIRIKEEMGLEAQRCERWQMSHEASSERMEFQRQGLPFAAWPTGRTRGIEQLKNALAVRHTDLPHPFKPTLAGSPSLFLIVDDEELVNHKTDRGLSRWRSEFMAYHWAQLKSGEPMTTLVPYALYNDAVDTVRAAAADYFPASAGLTNEEVIRKYLPEQFHENIPALNTPELELSRLFALKEAKAKAAAELAADTIIVYDDLEF